MCTSGLSCRTCCPIILHLRTHNVDKTPPANWVTTTVINPATFLSPFKVLRHHHFPAALENKPIRIGPAFAAATPSPPVTWYSKVNK